MILAAMGRLLVVQKLQDRGGTAGLQIPDLLRIVYATAYRVC